MKTETLIQTLVADARPVRRLPSLNLRLAGWACLTLLFAALGATAWGLRIDLAMKLRQSYFLLEGGSLLVLFLIAARSAFQLSVPGEERRTTILLPLLTFLLWPLALSVHYVWGPEVHHFSQDAMPGLLCILRILSIGIFPAGLCLFMLRKAATKRSRWAAFFLALSSFSVASLGTQALCTIDRPLHVFLWHFLPTFFVGILVSLLANKLFTRPARRIVS